MYVKPVVATGIDKQAKSALWFVFLAGALFVSWTDSRALAQEPQDLVGSALRISSGVVDESVADIAYDSVNNRFLIVWEAAVAAGFNGIRYAIANADGSIRLAQSILPFASSLANRPKVAFGSSFGYVVLWEDSTVDGGRDIFALPLSVDGVAGNAANLVNVSQVNPANQSFPAIAAVGTRDFFIVWQDERNGTPEIYGQSIVNGSFSGNNVRLTQNTVPDTRPAIAPGQNGHSMIVWETLGPGGSSDIAGRIVSREGVLRTTAIPLGFGISVQIAPDVAFAAESNRYLVVWDSSLGGLATQIEGALVDINFSSFAFFVTPGVIFTSTLTEQEAAVAYDDFNDHFLVVWQHLRPLSVPQDWDVLGRYISIDGEIAADEAVAVVNTSSQLLPAIAFGTQRDEFFVAWHDNRNVQTDIWAQRVEFVPPTLTLTAPNGGESWQAGTSQNITWTSNLGSNTTVTLELLRGGSFASTISASTENDGTFSWTIPAGTTPATDYRVRIASPLSGLTDTSDANFSITAAPGQLQLTSPNGGETWQRGTQHTITWTGDSCPSVRLELLKGGALDSTIIASTPNDGSFAWTIPSGQITGTDYRVRVVCTTDAANTDTSDANFTITDVPQPTIAVTAPNGGESWTRGNTQSIQWSSSGGVGSTVNIILLKSGAVNSTIVSGTPNDGQFSWNIPSNQPTGNDYRVQIVDASNASVSDQSDGNFSIIDSTTPVWPTLLTPTAGATLNAGSTFQITWSTGNVGGTVKIELLKGGSLFSTISPNTFNNGAFNWNISSTLPAGNDYRVRLTSNQPGALPSTSGNFTIVAGSRLQVRIPNGGEVWRAGETRAVTWVADGGGTVRIDLLKGGAVDSTIAASTANDGSLLWTIPAGQTPGSDYRVRISLTASPQVSDESNGNFTISPPPLPDLTVEGFNFFPQDVSRGDTIFVAGNVVNQGPGATSAGFWIELRVSQELDFSPLGPILTDSYFLQQTLAPGQSFDLLNLTRTVDPGLPDGAWVVGVRIDPGNEIAEENDNNNTLWLPLKKLYVGPRPSRADHWSLYK